MSLSAAKAIRTFLAFCFVLAFFFFRFEWFAAGVLEIKGESLSESTVLTMHWDSGAGENPYETDYFPLTILTPAGDKTHRIEITYTGKKNRVSRGTSVIVNEVRIDGKGISIGKSSLEKVVRPPGSGWRLTRPESRILLEVVAEKNIEISFNTDDRSGIAAVSIDGRTREYDLFQSNWHATRTSIQYWIRDANHRFHIWKKLPRYRIRTLSVEASPPVRFSSATIRYEGKELPLSVGKNGSATEISLAETNRKLKRRFHPVYFLLQMLFSALTVWMVMGASAKAARFSSLKEVFRGKSRGYFWLFLLGATASYSLWLAAYWPGVLSVDSMNIWRAAGLPEVHFHYHPLLNILFYLYLMNIWNHPAVVALAQVLLTSLLTAYVFFSLLRHGVRLRWVLPFYLLAIFSIPIGAYTVTLWKDVPFALLVVFWGITLVQMYVQRKRGDLRISKQKGAALFLLYVSLAFIRHNGLVYLVVIPLMLLLLRIVSFRKLLPALLSVVIGIGLFAGWSLFRREAQYPFFLRTANHILHQTFREPLSEKWKRGFLNYTHLLDINRNRKVSDLWHYYPPDRYAYDYLKASGWNDFFRYRDPSGQGVTVLRNLLDTLYEKSYQKPWIYLTWNPFFLLPLYPLTVILMRRFPCSAIFSGIVLVQIGTLLFFLPDLNWRYYYFVLFSFPFFLPLLILDRRLSQSFMYRLSTKTH